MVKIYVVMCFYKNEDFGVADFWGIPYCTTCFKDIHILKRAIIKKALKYRVWKKKDFYVRKVIINSKIK